MSKNTTFARKLGRSRKGQGKKRFYREQGKGISGSKIFPRSPVSFDFALCNANSETRNEDGRQKLLIHDDKIKKVTISIAFSRMLTSNCIDLRTCFN